MYFLFLAIFWCINPFKKCCFGLKSFRIPGYFNSKSNDIYTFIGKNKATTTCVILVHSTFLIHVILEVKLYETKRGNSWSPVHIYFLTGTKMTEENSRYSHFN